MQPNNRRESAEHLPRSTLLKQGWAGHRPLHRTTSLQFGEKKAVWLNSSQTLWDRLLGKAEIAQRLTWIEHKWRVLMIDPKLLISRQFSSHTKDALNLDEDLVITYYIDDVLGTQSLADGRTIKTLPHSTGEIEFINDLFAGLDQSLAIDFERSYTSRNSDIDIYSVVDVSTWDNSTLGEVVDQESLRRSGSWWDVLWRDTDDKPKQNDSDLYSIVHEIGHSLGLSHPNEKPFDPRWDSSDTVMSYNPSADGYNTDYSNADLRALEAIWGSDGDSDSSNPGELPKPNKDKEPSVEGDDLDINEVWGSNKSDRLTGTGTDDDVFGFSGDDNLKGLRGDDILFGDRGNDTLKGGSGDDIIDGGKGFNIHNGGTGSDLFVLDLKGYQFIRDFSLRKDELWILKGSNTYWQWEWEYDGGNTYIYDLKSGDDFAELEGRHNLNRALLFG